MKKWLAACLCTVMLLSLAACGASTKKASGPYAEMTEDEWEELWNEAKTHKQRYTGEVRVDLDFCLRFHPIFVPPAAQMDERFPAEIRLG